MRTFSRLEVRDIVISFIALSVVFSYPAFLREPSFLLFSALLVGVGFVGHELMHKFTARKYGFWAEFKMWPTGILLAFVFAIGTGGNLIFAAPGAVFFAGSFFHKPNHAHVGRIGVAGPLFNIVLMILFLAASFIFPLNLFRIGAVINAWLAAFNMIPVHPLDGGKVFQWNKGIWLAVMLAAAGGFLLSI